MTQYKSTIESMEKKEIEMLATIKLKTEQL
jgi:hypothetical protein